METLSLLPFINDFVGVIGATSGEGLATGIRKFVGPILMLLMGLVSITFLFKREMTQFVIFLGISIVVAIIFYAPDFIETIAKGVNKESGVNGAWKK